MTSPFIMNSEIRKTVYLVACSKCSTSVFT